MLRRVTPSAPSDVVKALVDSHQRFLAFLERRVGSRETAEDILQDGFVRALERADTLQSADSATAWFYRLLRNALVDHYRRRGAEDRALAAMADDLESNDEDVELRDTICACMGELISTLKPEYGTALRRVELEGVKVGAFADEAGITVSNASVRLHRAREALRQRVLESCGTCVTHGCRNCDCGQHDSTAPVRSPSSCRVDNPSARQ
jgi:RNA polymerase sigma-70 factor (ECF subfamily)